MCWKKTKEGPWAKERWAVTVLGFRKGRGILEVAWSLCTGETGIVEKPEARWCREGCGIIQLDERGRMIDLDLWSLDLFFFFFLVLILFDVFARNFPREQTVKKGQNGMRDGMRRRGEESDQMLGCAAQQRLISSRGF